MKWDGSYLGEIFPHHILNQFTHKGKQYWKLGYEGTLIFCIVYQFKDHFRCLIDELKPIFGLPKLGTHTLLFNRQKYTIVKVNFVNGEKFNLVIVDPPLQPTSPVSKLEVQQTFGFRYLMGLRVNSETHIVLKVSKRKCFPVSFEDAVVDFKQSKISEKVYDTWFENTTLGESIARLTNFQRDRDTIVDAINKIKREVEEVILRVDKDLVWVNSFIMDRLFESYIECTERPIPPW